MKTQREWTAREMSVAAQAWQAGMCARCIGIVLQMAGYADRSAYAIRGLAQRNREQFPVREKYPRAPQRGRERCREMGQLKGVRA